jgi:AraC-like DNA-binding protein
MKDIIHIETISQLHEMMELPKPKHPLITVVREYTHFNPEELEKVKFTTDLYKISLKANCPITIINYGRTTYDFQEGTMVFMGPRQVVEYKPQDFESTATGGWTLMFHPDLLRKSELGKKMSSFSFFSYSSNEALHLSDEEKDIVSTIIDIIEREYSNNIDAHSQNLIIANLELLLQYCTRFYDRQFYTRTNWNQDSVSLFESVLMDYYSKDVEMKGLPTVQYCADQLNMSAKYLSDLLRKETGRNTQDHIHHFVINKAKNMLLGTKLTVSEIAYSLGFEYPQYFSKLFKKKVKVSPKEFRKVS